MNTHSPSCLPGPVNRSRSWWQTPPTNRMERPNPDRPEEGSMIRRTLVERVRREIAAGTYDTPEKFEAALDRLLSSFEDD